MIDVNRSNHPMRQKTEQNTVKGQKIGAKEEASVFLYESDFMKVLNNLPFDCHVFK
jgi:hypothetical protein